MNPKFWAPFVSRNGREPKDFIWDGACTSFAASAG
jgi:hypothetical protein